MGALVDLTGQRFGWLTVTKRSGAAKDKHAVWECVCACGVTTRVSSNNLNSKATKSCGCKRRMRGSAFRSGATRNGRVSAGLTSAIDYSDLPEGW